ncbi:MAG TPA: hypothetical protein VFY93_01550 [Planctomycetota bacterium]|nr:hypothetical protein [Planctomycetota bacterium]
MRALPFVLLLAGLAAGGPDDPHRLRPDHAPTPFTADEIRDACGEGRTDSFRIERDGQKPLTHTMTFLKGDREGVDMEFTTKTEDGKVAEPVKRHQTWKDLQAHASFPEGDTKLSEEAVEVPAGKFECVLYTVHRGGDDAPTLRLWFAKKLPGPPVKMTTEQTGKVVSSMTLLEHKDGAKPEEEKKAPPEKDKEKAGG